LYPRTRTVGGSQHGDGKSYPRTLGANSKAEKRIGNTLLITC
jgi:hypothetical protein